MRFWWDDETAMPGVTWPANFLREEDEKSFTRRRRGAEMSRLPLAHFTPAKPFKTASADARFCLQSTAPTATAAFHARDGEGKATSPRLCASA
jgi:hypothetical protein